MQFTELSNLHHNLIWKCLQLPCYFYLKVNKKLYYWSCWARDWKVLKRGSSLLEAGSFPGWSGKEEGSWEPGKLLMGDSPGGTWGRVRTRHPWFCLREPQVLATLCTPGGTTPSVLGRTSGKTQRAPSQSTSWIPVGSWKGKGQPKSRFQRGVSSVPEVQGHGMFSRSSEERWASGEKGQRPGAHPGFPVTSAKPRLPSSRNWWKCLLLSLTLLWHEMRGAHKQSRM